jgi:clusterin-associated protein 1
MAAKVERKRAEQERLEKRLKGLKQVRCKRAHGEVGAEYVVLRRPAYMEEYEALEAELKVVYEQYVERARNLSSLERQLEDVHRSEQSKQQQHDRALKRMQKRWGACALPVARVWTVMLRSSHRLREEELRILRGEQDVDENRIDDDVFDSEKEVIYAMQPRFRRQANGAPPQSSAEEEDMRPAPRGRAQRPLGADQRGRRTMSAGMSDGRGGRFDEVRSSVRCRSHAQLHPQDGDGREDDGDDGMGADDQDDEDEEEAEDDEEEEESGDGEGADGGDDRADDGDDGDF